MADHDLIHRTQISAESAKNGTGLTCPPRDAAVDIDARISQKREQRRARRKQALADGVVGLPNVPLLVLIELVSTEEGYLHVYGLWLALRARSVRMGGQESDAPSERAISLALDHLEELKLVERIRTLERNPQGPVRQNFRLCDRHRALQVIADEKWRREQAMAHLFQTKTPLPAPQVH